MRRAVRLLALVACALGAVIMWPQNLGGQIAYVMVSGHSMAPTMHNGDVAVIRSQASYRAGDIVAYQVPAHEVGGGADVIHRIVGGNARSGFITRGDNNQYNDPWRPHPADIVGVRWTLIPQAGAVFTRLRSPAPLAGFAACLAVIAALPLIPGRNRKRPRRQPSNHPRGQARRSASLSP